MDQLFHRIPLFPLGIVLMPETPLPLHIFEDRYRQMIRRCRETGEEFGVVSAVDRVMRTVGCTARITSVLSEFEDGRVDIMTQGKQRFYVSDLHEELPYFEGTVHYFTDESTTDGGPVDGELSRGIELFRRVSQLAEVSLDTRFLTRLSAEALSFVLAGTCTTDPEERQSLLELRSTRERLTRCIASLEQTARIMELQQRVSHMVGTGFGFEELRN
ncbi:MAG TPA: LON peptidase substrate-binding domain-containing protein [Spirochaetia bacterium]|nr:LON peptidase substrate-binding domain-containing protein [Spirochaetia bacterium]